MCIRDSYSSALVFGNFEPGFCFLLLWAASFPVIYTVKLVHFRNDHQSSFWLNQRFCTPGLLIFVTTYVGVYLYDLNRSFTNWDEFSHWGVMIKEMLRLNTFYSVDSSVLAVHKDYPPAIQIIEWLWCRLSGGCYEEAYLYRALHIFILSFAFPVVDTIIRHRSKLQWRIIVGFMAVVLFFIPVSYTHLDVYKRQMYASPFWLLLAKRHGCKVMSKVTGHGQGLSIWEQLMVSTMSAPTLP